MGRMSKVALLLVAVMVFSPVGYVLAHSITVDGSPTDWKADTTNQSYNTWELYTNVGEYVWKDNVSDYRTDNGNVAGWCDLKEFRVTSDSNYVYFLVTFYNLSGIKYIGTNGGTFVDIAINDGTGTGTYFAGNMDTQTYNSTTGTGMKWKYQVVINIAASNYTGKNINTTIVKPDTNWGALFYIVNDSWKFQQPAGALAAVSLPNNAIEIRLPRSMFANDGNNLEFELVTANGWSTYSSNSGGTWDIGGSSISNVVDAMTNVSGNTWNEVKDGVVDYYTKADITQVPFYHSLLAVLLILLAGLVIYRRL